MLLPSRTKYRTQMRGVNKGFAMRGNKISFGDYALKSDTRCYLTSRQIEAARKAISHKTKRGGKLWIRVFPDKPISKKPNETRKQKSPSIKGIEHRKEESRLQHSSSIRDKRSNNKAGHQRPQRLWRNLRKRTKR